jgi:hypothetical protein
LGYRIKLMFTMFDGLPEGETYFPELTNLSCDYMMWFGDLHMSRSEEFHIQAHTTRHVLQ